MAYYSQLSDYTDPSFRVAEQDLLAADVLVDAHLAVKGITRADIAALNTVTIEPSLGIGNLSGNTSSFSLVPPLLTQLAVAYASEDVAMKKANTTNTLLQEKSLAYAAQAKRIEQRVTHVSLGLVPPGSSTPGTGSGLGSIMIGRG